MLLFAFHQAKSDWSDWFCAEILSKYNGLLSLTFIHPGIEIETIEEKDSPYFKNQDENLLFFLFNLLMG